MWVKGGPPCDMLGWRSYSRQDIFGIFHVKLDVLLSKLDALESSWTCFKFSFDLIQVRARLRTLRLTKLCFIQEKFSMSSFQIFKFTCSNNEQAVWNSIKIFFPFEGRWRTKFRIKAKQTKKLECQKRAACARLNRRCVYLIDSVNVACLKHFL